MIDSSISDPSKCSNQHISQTLSSYNHSNPTLLLPFESTILKNQIQEGFFRMPENAIKLLRAILSLGASLQLNRLICCNFGIDKLMIDADWNISDPLSSATQEFQIMSPYLKQFDDKQSITLALLDEKQNNLFSMISSDSINLEEQIFVSLMLLFASLFENNFKWTCTKSQRKMQIEDVFDHTDFSVISSCMRNKIFSCVVIYYELFGVYPLKIQAIEAIASAFPANFHANNSNDNYNYRECYFEINSKDIIENQEQLEEENQEICTNLEVGELKQVPM